METTYDPKNIESHWSKLWLEQGYAQPANKGPAYAIALPPPNVTGTLHMGHGFQHTLMDALIRHARMLGHNTLWQPGTDHAGIATQLVVERELSKKNLSRHDLGREKFLEKVWEWRDQSGHTIQHQIQRMGNSLDWQRDHFSMDTQITNATYTAFIQLYEKGLIYRSKRLVNWDPKLNTAISDLEVITQVEQGHLWHIRYPLADGTGHVIIATTRPETLLGDTAVAVHPDDERYQHLIGKKVKLPLCNREIPIIADSQVVREFGTGCVKITPAHDFNDYEMGLRHELPLINIFTLDAHLNENAPSAYQGMERDAARKTIVADLEKLNLLEKVEPYQVNIPRGDRSGVVIEPLLTDQWFVKMESLAKQAILVVKNGDIKLIPESWNKTYLQWLDNIKDWCISRQLWWGHRIPVWYDAQGKTYVGFDETDVRQRYQIPQSAPLTQDEDVLDTWFTAALWPFSSLGWPEATYELKTFYPTSVLVTGFDIIFFWVARMVMMGLHFTGKVPFKEVYITGLIRDAQGQKMSKSKGNILDPIDLIDGIALDKLIEKRIAGLLQPQMRTKIEKITRKEFPEGIKAHGTDALRFTFCALDNTGRDIKFDMKRIEGYRNFCNKLWNASRYVLMNTEKENINPQNIELSLADRWIKSILQDTIKRVNHYFKTYRFDLLAQALYEFTWNQYCDWYLELAKCILTDKNASPALKSGAQYTLLEVLENLLRLMHPVMPYITEEIWHKVAGVLNKQAATIMLQPYPEYDSSQVDNIAQTEIEWLKQVIMAIRNVRGEMNISPSQKIKCIFSKGESGDQQRLEQGKSYIQAMAKVEEIQWLNDSSQLEANAAALVSHLEIHIPLTGLIDKKSEMTRLGKEIGKLQKEYERSKNKLADANYVAKAPQDVVDKERDRLQQTEHTLQKLQEHYSRIEELN